MDLRRIRYTVALMCLVMTVVLVTYKFSDWQRVVTEQSDTGSSITILTWETASWVSQTLTKSETPSSPTTWTELSTTIPSPQADHTLVQQWSNPYLLMDNLNLISLATTVYSGVWTWVIKLSTSPLIVYYRYQLPDKLYTYIYDATTNSSRALDQLVMVGNIWQAFIFSILESDWYRGMSVMVDGQLQTLYTGAYTSAQYLWDIIKLNNNQQIYLPLRSTWS